MASNSDVYFSNCLSAKVRIRRSGSWVQARNQCVARRVDTGKRAISNARETIASVSFRGGDERVERPSSPNQSLLGF